MAVLIFGCPKRQTSPRLIYVPAPPPAASEPSQPASGTLVIQEPAPPETVEAAPPPPPPAPKPVQRRRRPASAEAETPEQPAEPAAAEPTVPSLEPRESPQEQNTLRVKIIQLHADIEGQMAQLNAASLSAEDKKTLEDVRLFLSQSRLALQNGDLTRALNLARKASLLINSLTRKP